MYGAELGKNTTYDAIQWRLVGHDHVTCKTLPESIFAKGESRTTVDYAPISHQILPQLEPPELQLETSHRLISICTKTPVGFGVGDPDQQSLFVNVG